MNIKFVTCSGTNETTNIPQLVNLLQAYPFAEIGVQVSEEQCIMNTKRLPWIYSLASHLHHMDIPINAALHVNRSWVEDLGQGKISVHLLELFNIKAPDGNPLFRRVQLNFKIGREKTPDIKKLQELMAHFPIHRFILSYNESNKEMIQHLYDRGVEFDLLYDASFGKGIAPSSRSAPVFCNVLQGYAGGITPDNVTEVLDEINAHLINRTTAVYIDAQRGLEDDNEHLDLAKCHQYLQRAADWCIAH